ncbi:MAG: hypothetical protein NTW87_35910, partial [Planctomycetota bacterium]|nr:hypothetical protein [Planctomycetota bacterium]
MMRGRDERMRRQPFVVAVPLLLLALSGCRKEQAENGETPRLTTPRTSEVKLVDHTPQPWAPPLRRASFAVQDMPTLARLDAAMPEAMRASPVVTAAQDGAQTRIRALLPSPAEQVCSEELKPLGFQPEPGETGQAATWTRTVAVADRPAFEKQVLARLTDTARRLNEAEALDLQCRVGGHMVWQAGGDGSFLPGALVYTGHPMDLALADAGKDPRLFFAVEGVDRRASTGTLLRAYVRGGPLFVTNDGALHMGDFALAGEWKRVPADTEQISVRPDGTVLAFAPAGAALELGRLQVVKLDKHKPGPLTGAAAGDGPPQPVELRGGASPLCVGH